MPKNYSSTYLYGKFPEYDKLLFEFIMNAERIDKNTDAFDEILFEVKRRQVSPALVKVLKSDAVILLSGKKQLPRQFKAFCAKDIKGQKKNDLKVYIDCTDLITKNSAGNLVCKNIDVFISYLVSAMVNYIYYKDEKRFINNSKIISVGARTFADLLTNVVDYVAKISSSPKNKAYCRYLSALYYISSIMGKDYTTPGNLHVCRQIAGLSDREADIVDMQIKQESFTNIKFFTETLSDILRLPKLTIDVIVERWMFLYGTATVFALELFPAYATMICDCYVGAYLNNQKTIEKITGTGMVEFSKAVLNVGDESV